MTNFTKGDRVELNQDYDGQKKGDTGVVIDAEDPGTALRGLEVRMDKNNAIVWAFVERWDKLPAKAPTYLEKSPFNPGDRIKIVKFASLDGKLGTVREPVREDTLYIPVTVDGSNHKSLFLTEEIEAYTEPVVPAKQFKVGDRVQRKGLCFQYSKHKGKDLVVTKLREEESDFDYTVSIVGSVRSADAGNYSESELEAFVPPKTSGVYAENSGFKFGDRVKVNEDNAFMANLGGKLGTVIEGGGSSLIRVLVDGQEAYAAFYKSEISQYTEPAPFKVGDYVEVVRSAYNLGRKGWVVEPTPYWAARNDDCVHITTQKGGKSEFRFGAESLKAIEEPWVPKFKKGDWVEVPASHNSEWAGIGQVTEEASKDLDIAVVKMVTGKSYGVGRSGGFREGDLLPAEEPKPFNIGDYVEVVANPESCLSHHAGTKGWVVEPSAWERQGWIYVSLEGKGKQAKYRYDPKDLQAAEEPKPVPTRWTEKAPIGQAAYTTNSHGIDRVLHKTAENEWKVSYPVLHTGESKALVTTYNDKDAYTIASNAVLV